jgi:hypothetical protein
MASRPKAVSCWAAVPSSARRRARVAAMAEKEIAERMGPQTAVRLQWSVAAYAVAQPVAQLAPLVFRASTSESRGLSDPQAGIPSGGPKGCGWWEAGPQADAAGPSGRRRAWVIRRLGSPVEIRALKGLHPRLQPGTVGSGGAAAASDGARPGIPRRPGPQHPHGLERRRLLISSATLPTASATQPSRSSCLPTPAAMPRTSAAMSRTSAAMQPISASAAFRLCSERVWP